MIYDFDQPIDRKGTASVKWDSTPEIFGQSNLLPMWIADMDFPSPMPVIDALKRRAEHGFFGYTSRPDSFYKAIEKWMKKKHGWQIKREWICTSPGIVTGLSLLINTFTDPGDKVIVQPPVYYPFINLIKNNGREVVYNPLRYRTDLNEATYEMDFDDLKQKIVNTGAKMLILCSPHNPVGRVWTKEELKRLGELCLEHQVLVVSDEVHSEIIFPNHCHTPFPLVSKSFELSSIVCVSPSKTFNLAGLHTSVIIIPNAQLRERYLSILERFSLNKVNIFGTVALESAYKYGEDWLNQLLTYLYQNVLYLSDYIRERIPKIKVIKPQGTYLVWLDCRELGMDDQQLEQFMIGKANVALRHGYLFGPGGEGFVRINIACPRSILHEGLKRIERAVKYS